MASSLELCDSGSSGSGIPAMLVYTRDNNTRQVMHVPSAPGDTVDTEVQVEVTMKDARTIDAKLALHGFELVECPASLTKKEYYENPEKVDKVHYREVAEAIKACSGAADVIPFHWQIRRAEQGSGSSKTDHQHGTIGQPAGAIHCDYTVKTALDLFASLAKKEHRKGRYAVINAWRNIGNHPIENDHLAMCDARTIIAPDDFVAYDVIQNGKMFAQTYRLDPGHHKFHQWYYFPRMVRNEALIFMQYDSDSRSRSRYTFHTSFRSPAFSSDHPRESIETRCVAFFPDHVPNTIPDVVMKEDELICKCIEKLMVSLNYADQWGEGQKWMRKTLHKPDGVREVVRHLIPSCAKEGHHGMDKCSSKEIEEIQRRLLSPESGFAERAKKNFPPL